MLVSDIMSLSLRVEVNKATAEAACREMLPTNMPAPVVPDNPSAAESVSTG